MSEDPVVALNQVENQKESRMNLAQDHARDLESAVRTRERMGKYSPCFKYEVFFCRSHGSQLTIYLMRYAK